MSEPKYIPHNFASMSEEKHILSFTCGDLNTVCVMMRAVADYWKDNHDYTTFIRNTPDGYEVYGVKNEPKEEGTK